LEHEFFLGLLDEHGTFRPPLQVKARTERVVIPQSVPFDFYAVAGIYRIYVKSILFAIMP